MGVCIFRAGSRGSGGKYGRLSGCRSIRLLKHPVIRISPPARQSIRPSANKIIRSLTIRSPAIRPSTNQSSASARQPVNPSGHQAIKSISHSNPLGSSPHAAPWSAAPLRGREAMEEAKPPTGGLFRQRSSVTAKPRAPWGAVMGQGVYPLAR